MCKLFIYTLGRVMMRLDRCFGSSHPLSSSTRFCCIYTVNSRGSIETSSWQAQKNVKFLDVRLRLVTSSCSSKSKSGRHFNWNASQRNGLCSTGHTYTCHNAIHISYYITRRATYTKEEIGLQVEARRCEKEVNRPNSLEMCNMKGDAHDWNSLSCFLAV